MRRRKRLYWKTLVALALLVGLYALFRTEIQPIIDEMAKMKMDGVISTLMNNAINEQIADGVIDYDRMVLLEKDVDGNLTALRTNMSEVNHLKTQILHLINIRLEQLQQQTVGLPLGSIILPELFSGQGPEIPIRLISIGSSGADFENQFSEAGINQTLHRILLTAHVDVTVLVPGGTVNKRVTTEVVVAETIVVGSVPQNYVTIEDNRE
ncbi:MAG: sporulation protein YunB [Ruminococcaceae bacterium]|nr:sporulation protein YunB [Oscillospiraceae bacterium]